MSVPIVSVPSRVFGTISNVPLRKKSTPTLRIGQENAPAVSTRNHQSSQLSPPHSVPSSSRNGWDHHADPAPRPLAERWAPKDGLIVIKLSVPMTDDIWAFRVREDVSLIQFRACVVQKVGFEVRLEGKNAKTRAKFIKDESAFRTWVKGRVREGRNQLLVAHKV